MTDEKRQRGRWAKGSSGNPAGRKPGTGAVTRLRQAIAGHVSGIIERLVEQALRGDAASARLLLERVCPALRPTEDAVQVPLDGETLTAQGRAVLLAVSEGRLAPGQGAALLESLGTMAKLIESDELAARVAALERAGSRDDDDDAP
jgi:hypothetical protein